MQRKSESDDAMSDDEAYQRQYYANSDGEGSVYTCTSLIFFFQSIVVKFGTDIFTY